MEERQLGGIGFMIGNAALFANGLIANRCANTLESRQAGAARMVTSAMWGASGGFLAKYGDRPVSDQQHRLEAKLAAYLKDANVPMDAETLKKADDETKEGWYKKIEDFFYAHPIECTNSYYAAASTGFAASGKLRRKDGNINAGNANLGVSALVMTGALASIIIPEKTHEQVVAQGDDGTLWGKVQEHPLGYVRWLFLGADAMAGVEALGEYQAAKKLPVGHSYRNWQFGMAGLSALAMVTTLAADWATSGTKKAGGTPEERAAAQEQILTASARHLAMLPAEQRDMMAHDIAHYVSQQAELRFNDHEPEKIAQQLMAKVDELAQQKQNQPPHLQRLMQPALGYGLTKF